MTQAYQSKWRHPGWPSLEGPFLPARPFYPKEEDVYRALELTPLAKTKVVFIGYDPYHSLAVADGLAFSSRRKATPKMLAAIKKELRDDLGVRKTTNDLTGWAVQGVLLLNMALTVKPDEPGSHLELWEPFFKDVLKALRGSSRSFVIVLCGKKAWSFNNEFFVDKKKDVVLEVGHPSPMNRGTPFLGSRIFSQINFALKELGHDCPDWSV